MLKLVYYGRNGINGVSFLPDALPSLFFKYHKYCLAKPLALLFTQMLSVGFVPSDWLRAIIIPVFKKGSAAIATNYRPISLTLSLIHI